MGEEVLVAHHANMAACKSSINVTDASQDAAIKTFMLILCAAAKVLAVPSDHHHHTPVRSEEGTTQCIIII